jgi:mRNA interferase RelE/StbE
VKRYEIKLTKEAKRDAKQLPPRMRDKLRKILVEVLSVEPYSGKKLIGDLEGYYSLRLSYNDRIVYSIEEPTQTVIVHRAKTHYGD